MRFHLTVQEKDSYKVLGQMVRYHRLKNQYSLRDLSSLANISHTLISNIEKGKVVSSPETMKDLLRVLGISFVNSKELQEEFLELYDEAFNYLFEYEYTKASKVMEKLFENEKQYVDSLVASDYLALKYMYLALKDELYGEYETNIARFTGVYDFLNDRQKQIFSFTFGVYMYNKGQYKEAYDHFVKAKTVGVRDLDLLVNVFIVKTFVKMYRFMDAITLANILINELEFELLYIRAMEVRLSIIYAYTIVRKHDDAFSLLDKVYRFAKNYNTKFILNECNLLYAGLYFNLNQFDLAEIKLNQMTEQSMFVYYLKMKLAHRKNDFGKVEEFIQKYRTINQTKNLLKSEYVLDVVLNDLELRTFSEKELVKRFNYLLDFSEKSVDLELIDSTYSLYIKYCQKNRQYKKALQLSEDARRLRKYGVNSRNVSK